MLTSTARSRMAPQQSPGAVEDLDIVIVEAHGDDIAGGAGNAA